MWQRISQHPFPVEAHFDHSLVLAYAYPISALQMLIPDCLELDCFEDKWAFAAVAMVQTRKLRPKGFPACVGSDFFLAGYRIFVRYRSNSGRRLRGLYILQSETDKNHMRWLGNLFTNYNYSKVEVNADFTIGGMARVESPTTGLKLIADIGEHESISLPEGSPFPDWRSARMFAGPMPFTFSVNPTDVIIVEGKRADWQPRPVRVIEAQIPYIKQLTKEPAILANAFITNDIPYEWTRGRREPRS